jgi:tetratricopeptide (TPR) repeat protein
MRKVFAALASVLVAGLMMPGFAAPAGAQQGPDWQACSGRDLDAKISGCTRIIDRGSREPVKKRAAAYGNRGFAFRQKGDYDQAIRDFDEAVRLNPKDAVVYYDRGVAYGRKGEVDREISDYDEAIRLDPRFAYAYNNRGVAYRQKGNYDGAMRDYNQAIRLDPKFALAYYNRGVAFRQKGDHDRAILDYDQAILLNPKYAAAYNNRGIAHFHMGNAERARSDLRKVLELDPNHKEARDALARIEAGTATAPTVTKPGIATAPVQIIPAPAAVPARREKRVALVIGNGAYAMVPALSNPANDARAVADSFRRVGFTSVRSEANLNREALVNSLKAFAAEADGADWAVVYFAGHGIEVGGVNWLIPVDATLKTDRDVQYEAVSLDQVLGAVEGARKLGILILDACRDNPFAAQMRSTVASRSIGRGLASVEPRRGTLVAYAAKHGQTALDGDSSNSPFVSALVRHIQTPGVEINKVFRLVRDEVLTATNNRQEPFVYGTLPAQDFYFASR